MGVRKQLEQQSAMSLCDRIQSMLFERKQRKSKSFLDRRSYKGNSSRKVKSSFNDSVQTHQLICTNLTQNPTYSYTETKESQNKQPISSFQKHKQIFSKTFMKKFKRCRNKTMTTELIKKGLNCSGLLGMSLQLNKEN